MSLSAAFLGFCPTCNKAFSKETSHKRHVSYCRRAQTRNKGRPRSCVACNSSKVKCSFTQPQCARCEAKGIACVYSQVRQRIPTVESTASSSSASSGASSSDADVGQFSLPKTPISLDVDAELDATVAMPWLETFAGATSFQDFMDVSPIMTLPNSILSPLGLSPSLDFPLEVNDKMMVSPIARMPLSRLKHQDLAVDHISDLIILIIKSFPRMMLRRQTFPSFIHPYWHWSTLPEQLANCMSISQLFEARTAETKPFLWKLIDAEESRFREQTDTMSIYDIQWSTQALMIYMTMAIVDQVDDHSVRLKMLLRTLENLSARHHILLGVGFCSTTEVARPSVSWDNWIFAESNRRIACLWFVICRVFATHDYPCPGLSPLEQIPLPAPKTMWEARTLEDWESEKAIHDSSRTFKDFGELIEARRRPNDMENAQRLEIWEAEIDKCGMMMNYAVAFV